MTPIFPEFAPLTLKDKELYKQLLKDYPVYSDISFATLHIWWNLEGKLAYTILNDNLVLLYSQPFDAENSGYCLIGTNKIDESIKTLLDQQKLDGKSVRLLHVPEFTINAIVKPGQFSIEEEPDYHEYILDSHGLTSLEGHDHWRNRGKIKRFLREVEGHKIEIRSLALTSLDEKDELMDTIASWEATKPTSNDPERTELDAVKKTVHHSHELDIENISLYIDDKLQAVVLYHLAEDGRSYVIHHIKVDYATPRIFDYMTHSLAKKAHKEAIDFLNMEMDLGVASLREHKLGLRPVHFVRKYTITPGKRSTRS